MKGSAGEIAPTSAAETGAPPTPTVLIARAGGSTDATPGGVSRKPKRALALAGLAVLALTGAVAVALLSGGGGTVPTPPSAIEHTRFLAAANADSVTAADIEAMSNPSLRSVLEMKALAAAQDQDGLDERLASLSATASDATSGAAVTLYLASKIDGLGQYLEENRLSDANILPALAGASESGDALATYWYAVNLRDQLLARSESGELVASDPEFLRYCDTLDLAAEQGMDEVARTQRTTDSCR